MRMSNWAGAVYTLTALSSLLTLYWLFRSFKTEESRLIVTRSFSSARLLLDGYRKSATRLLFWCGICLVGLCASQILLVIDRIYLPEIDLSLPRHVLSLTSLGCLLYGLILEQGRRK